MNRLTRILQDEDIQRVAPSVFATTAWRENSEHYRFLPTINAINALRDVGYNVVMAGQSRSRIEGKKEFTKHMLRMRHSNVLNPANVGDEIPEIVIVNSHDRTSAYKFMLGIFRLVCSNGMIVASSTIESLSVRHMGDRNLLESVIDVSARIIDEAPKVLEQINQFKSITLSNPEQLAFASAAKELATTSIDLEPRKLLTIRRNADRGTIEGENNLWNTSNIIQENLLRGGLLGKNSKNRWMRTREVKNIHGNVNINKALWKLTEELAKIKQ